MVIRIECPECSGMGLYGCPTCHGQGYLRQRLNRDRDMDLQLLADSLTLEEIGKLIIILQLRKIELTNIKLRNELIKDE